jgi:hypothetical protein
VLDGFEVFAGFKSSASIQAEAYDGADGVLLDRPNVAEIKRGGMERPFLENFVERDAAGLSVRFDRVGDDVRRFGNGNLLDGVRGFQGDDDAVSALLNAVDVMGVEKDVRRRVAAQGTGSAAQLHSQSDPCNGLLGQLRLSSDVALK